MTAEVQRALAQRGYYKGRIAAAQSTLPILISNAFAPSRLRSSTSWSCWRLAKRACSCASVGTRTNCNAASLPLR